MNLIGQLLSSYNLIKWQIKILPSSSTRLSPFNEHSISIRPHKHYKKLGGV
ncbi:MAG: hypothetical protein WBG58_14590 [Ignavibacteriaceae bacterium]